MTLTLTSPSFTYGQAIPKLFTGLGKNISPKLAWTDPPEGTLSFVLIVDDPDAPDPAAPKRTWVHWLLYNIPPETRELQEAISCSTLPAGTEEGLNDSQETGYDGPCPPIGTHRYYFKLYALSKRLDRLHHPTKKELEHAMEGAVLAKAELMGRFSTTMLS